MLNDHVLVRIGGGWDGLEHYLMTHVKTGNIFELLHFFIAQRSSTKHNSKTQLVARHRLTVSQSLL